MTLRYMQGHFRLNVNTQKPILGISIMKKKIINTDQIKSSFVSSTGHLRPAAKSPEDSLGELFVDVQNQHIYGDS